MNVPPRNRTVCLKVAALGGSDIGVELGPDERMAGLGVKRTRDVARILVCLSGLRSEWAARMHAVPIPLDPNRLLPL